MNKTAATLQEVLSRFQRKQDGLFTAWAKTQTPYPLKVQSFNDEQVLSAAMSRYGAEAWGLLLSQKADALIAADLSTVFGAERSLRLLSASRSTRESHLPSQSERPAIRPTSVAPHKATSSATPWTAMTFMQKGAVIATAGVALVAVVLFWKIILAVTVLAAFAGGFLLIIFTDMKKLGGSAVAISAAAIALIGSLMPAAADEVGGTSSDPSSAAETLCRRALEGERSAISHDNIGEYTIDSGMTGTRFMDYATLRPDGSYSVEVTNKSDFTDSMCPVRVVGRCIVDGQSVNVTQSLTRSGYISCG